jgi:hypothetical protein
MYKIRSLGQRDTRDLCDPDDEDEDNNYDYHTEHRDVMCIIAIPYSGGFLFKT